MQKMWLARDVVQAYYDAVNLHDPDSMAQCCAEEIEVTFPEAHRNWKSRTTAYEKFRSMFEKLPNFAAEWKFDDIIEKDVVDPSLCTMSITSETSDETKCDNKQIIVVVAHFTAEGYDARRKMIYTVSEGQICRIEHVDI